MLMGLGIGIPYRYSSGVGGSPDPLTLSEFYAPLTHSLILTRGTGSATYTRATTAWGFDNEGKLVSVPSGIPRFGGARFNGTDTWYNTDSGGSSISDATLLGYHSEGARTNSLLYSRDLTQAAWTATNVTAAETATGIDNSANSASTLTAGAANATILQTLTLASAARSSSAYVKRRTGTGTIYMTRSGFDVLGGSGTFDSSSNYTLVNATISGNKLNLSPSATLSTSGICAPVIGKTYRFTYTIDSITPGSSNIRFYVGAQAGTARMAPGTYTDDITYTSGGAAYYCFTGSGFISGVVDNLTIQCISEEDITSQINSSTWTRVKIENTSVANPSVGFLIATSGDSIDVDVVQDEAGAFSSSPIVTTSTAVTRNADVLSYQTASNWSDTAGAARASVNYEAWAKASGTAIGGTNGLALSTSTSGVQAKDGTNTVNGPTGTPSGTELLAIGWGSGAMSAASGGSLGTVGSYDGAFGLSTVAIGASAGYIKETHIWQSALTDAQLQTVTT